MFTSLSLAIFLGVANLQVETPPTEADQSCQQSSQSPNDLNKEQPSDNATKPLAPALNEVRPFPISDSVKTPKQWRAAFSLQGYMTDANGAGSAGVSGTGVTLYFLPLIDDEQSPYALLDFLQYPGEVNVSLLGSTGTYNQPDSQTEVGAHLGVSLVPFGKSSVGRSVGFVAAGDFSRMASGEFSQWTGRFGSIWHLTSKHQIGLIAMINSGSSGGLKVANGKLLDTFGYRFILSTEHFFSSSQTYVWANVGIGNLNRTYPGLNSGSVYLMTNHEFHVSPDLGATFYFSREVGLNVNAGFAVWKYARAYSSVSGLEFAPTGTSNDLTLIAPDIGVGFSYFFTSSLSLAAGYQGYFFVPTDSKYKVTANHGFNLAFGLKI